MKLKNIKYALLGLISLSFVACETQDDTETTYSPVYPIAGEWMIYYYNADGITKAAAGVAAIRLYNTSENIATKAWVRAGAAQAYALWGTVTTDVAAKTFTGTAIPNQAKPGTTFTILEGKVLENASKVPSGTTADSIYFKYSTTVDGKTYVIKGHRRTRFDGTE